MVDKRLVHLERVHREALEIREAAVTRTKVVDRDLQAHACKSAHHLDSLFRFAQGRVLGNFQLQVLRIQPGFLQNTADILDHVVERELLGTEVDRHLDVFVPHVDPNLGLLASHAQNLRTHGHNQARFFGNRNELARRDNATLAVVPADKRLETDNAVAVDNIHNGLVHQDEFTRLNSPANVEFQPVEVHRLFADATRKELHSTMVAALLHIAQDSICIGQQVFHAIPVLVHHYRHGYADIQFLAFQLERHLDLGMEVAHDRNQFAVHVALDIPEY